MIYKNEPIAPQPDWANTGTHGLTKREYFAAKAIQAILSTVKTEDLKFSFESIIPLLAVKYADMLIEELNKTEE